MYEFFLPFHFAIRYVWRASMYLQYSMAFENKQVKFYTIKTPVAKSFVQMIMRKGFPLRDKINFKIRFVPYDFSNDRFKRVARVQSVSRSELCAHVVGSQCACSSTYAFELSIPCFFFPRFEEMKGRIGESI